jgi:hypothetical protein
MAARMKEIYGRNGVGRAVAEHNSLKNRFSEGARENHVYNTDINRRLDLATEVDMETRDIRSLYSTVDDRSP